MLKRRQRESFNFILSTARRVYVGRVKCVPSFFDRYTDNGVQQNFTKGNRSRSIRVVV